MPDSNKFSAGRRKVILIAGLVLLVAAGLTAGVTMRWWQQAAEQAAPKSLPVVIDEAQNQALSGDFDAAHKTLNDELAKSGLTDEQKAGLYAQQGSTYHNQGNDQQALESYKQAVAIKPVTDLYVSMAVIAEKLNDTQGAIEYYRQAIAAIADNNPVGADDKKAFELHIKELEKQ